MLFVLPSCCCPASTHQPLQGLLGNIEPEQEASITEPEPEASITEPEPEASSTEPEQEESSNPLLLATIDDSTGGKTPTGDGNLGPEPVVS